MPNLDENWRVASLYMVLYTRFFSWPLNIDINKVMRQGSFLPYGDRQFSLAAVLYPMGKGSIVPFQSVTYKQLRLSLDMKTKVARHVPRNLLAHLSHLIEVTQITH